MERAKPHYVPGLEEDSSPDLDEYGAEHDALSALLQTDYNDTLELNHERDKQCQQGHIEMIGIKPLSVPEDAPSGRASGSR